jgi:hypothetical protein
MRGGGEPGRQGGSRVVVMFDDATRFDITFHLYCYYYYYS